MDANPQNFSADGLESVCIRVFNNQPAADIAASQLEANDIACWTSADDCGGLMPIMAGGGVRLFVSVANSQSAVEILSSELLVRTTALQPGEPPRDRPKFIIVAGIWVIYGVGLAGNLFSFRAMYFSRIDGLPWFFGFWLLAGLTAMCAFMLYRSVKNYLIQKARADAEQPD